MAALRLAARHTCGCTRQYLFVAPPARALEIVAMLEARDCGSTDCPKRHRQNAEAITRNDSPGEKFTMHPGTVQPQDPTYRFCYWCARCSARLETLVCTTAPDGAEETRQVCPDCARKLLAAPTNWRRPPGTGPHCAPSAPPAEENPR